MVWSSLDSRHSSWKRGVLLNSSLNLDVFFYCRLFLLVYSTYNSLRPVISLNGSLFVFMSESLRNSVNICRSHYSPSFKKTFYRLRNRSSINIFLQTLGISHITYFILISKKIPLFQILLVYLLPTLLYLKRIYFYKFFYFCVIVLILILKR